MALLRLGSLSAESETNDLLRYEVARFSEFLMFTYTFQQLEGLS